MFDIQISAEVSSVKLFTKLTKAFVVVRRCQMTFEREFDETIAAGLGGDAKKILGSLKASNMLKAVLDLDAISASAELVAGVSGEIISIPALHGVKATCTAPKDDEDSPRVSLEMECTYDRVVWNFLGDNGGGVVRFRLTRTQLQLSGETLRRSTKPAAATS